MCARYIQAVGVATLQLQSFTAAVRRGERALGNTIHVTAHRKRTWAPRRLYLKQLLCLRNQIPKGSHPKPRFDRTPLSDPPAAHSPQHFRRCKPQRCSRTKTLQWRQHTLQGNLLRSNDTHTPQRDRSSSIKVPAGTSVPPFEATHLLLLIRQYICSSHDLQASLHMSSTHMMEHTRTYRQSMTSKLLRQLLQPLWKQWT